MAPTASVDAMRRPMRLLSAESVIPNQGVQTSGSDRAIFSQTPRPW